MTSDQPARPANIANIVAINQGIRPLTMGDPSAPGLSAAQFRERLDRGCLVLDIRSQDAFGEMHVPDAYNIQLSSPEFEQRVGWVVTPDAGLLLVAERDSEIPESLRDLAFVGLDHRVQGYLKGGMSSWEAAGNPTRSLPQLSVEGLRERRAGKEAIRLLDVREAKEWREGHIEGSQNLVYSRLEEGLEDLGFAREDSLAVLCGTGMRSSTAASILLRKGFEKIFNVSGGMTAWLRAGYPVVRGPEACDR